MPPLLNNLDAMAIPAAPNHEGTLATSMAEHDKNLTVGLFYLKIIKRMSKQKSEKSKKSKAAKKQKSRKAENENKIK